MADKEWVTNIGADGLHFSERLGDLIANHRTRAIAVAKDTGISQSSLSDYISGKKTRAPDCATLITLAKYFSVSTDYLLGLTEVKTPSADLQAIVAETGLSEINACTLQQFSQNKFFAMIHNDIIELIHSTEIPQNYVYMLKALETPSPTTPDDLYDLAEDQRKIDSLRQMGYVHLTGEEAFRYHCARIADAFRDALVKKYLPTAEWRKTDGDN